MSSLPGASLLPGAQPYSHDGGPVGVLVCHGFTGSPASMRPWAQFLADAGLTIRLPRLPGHGTRWQDLQLTRWPDWFATAETAFLELRERCDQVFVAGLSVGAALALRLAEVHGRDVAGIVAVNPSLRSHQRSLALLPLLEKVLPSLPGVVDDVAKPGTTEGGYDRMPLRALRSLTELWAITRADLAKIDQPLLVYRSAVDHVVHAASTVLLFNNIRSVDAEERVLHNSFHVATLDHDAELIFSGSLEFIRRLSPIDLPDPSLAVQD